MKPVLDDLAAEIAARTALAKAELAELKGVADVALASKRAALEAALPSRARAEELVGLTRYAIAKQFDATYAKAAAALGDGDGAPPAGDPSDGALRLATAGMGCWAFGLLTLVALSATALAKALLGLSLAVAKTVVSRALKTPIALARLAVVLALSTLRLAVKLLLFLLFLPFKILFLPITLPLWLLSAKKKPSTSAPAKKASSTKAKKNQR